MSLGKWGRRIQKVEIFHPNCPTIGCQNDMAWTQYAIRYTHYDTMLKNAFILFAVALGVLLIFLPSFTKWQDLKEKDRQYQVKIRELEEARQVLLQEKQLLEEDPVYLEKVAREKMGIIREGEVIYRLVPADSDVGAE
ncbi:MAG: septum formation initiator family protein [Candidatus Omnitrophica bacterium]|nr:septum formation initiator family protein [Candidatus Omnitrophota bacterium]